MVTRCVCLLLGFVCVCAGGVHRLCVCVSGGVGGLCMRVHRYVCVCVYVVLVTYNGHSSENHNVQTIYKRAYSVFECNIHTSEHVKNFRNGTVHSGTSSPSCGNCNIQTDHVLHMIWYCHIL